MPNDISRKIRDLVRWLGKHDWPSDIASNGHWRITGPDGQVVCLPYSSSDRRALHNARSRLRRAGAPLPPR